jgi:tetratricopeptide (TPR) repeat protein
MSVLKNICFFALLCCAACTQNTDQKSSSQAKFTGQTAVVIPELHTRTEKLRQGEEWDQVQNYYAQHAEALRKDPANAEARLKLAEVFINEARITGEHPHYYPAALQMTESVVKSLEGKTDLTINQKDLLFRALSHQASVQLSLHDFAKAQATAQQAIAINPHNAYIYGCLVDASVELGQYAQAVEQCDKMVSIRPDLRSYARVSYLREIHGDVPGAIEAMDMAVKAGYPGAEQTEWSRLQLGGLYERQGKMAEAETQYQMCLAARPDYPFAIAALAALAEKKGDYAKAEALYKQAADIIPEVGFYVELAKIYQKTNRAAEATELIGEIEKMIAEDTAAGHNMALEAAEFQLEVVKNTDKALEYAQAEYARRPDNKDVNQMMASIWLAKGDKAQAKKYTDKARQI